MKFKVGDKIYNEKISEKAIDNLKEMAYDAVEIGYSMKGGLSQTDNIACEVANAINKWHWNLKMKILI